MPYDEPTIIRDNINIAGNWGGAPVIMVSSNLNTGEDRCMNGIRYLWNNFHIDFCAYMHDKTIRFRFADTANNTLTEFIIDPISKTTRWK